MEKIIDSIYVGDDADDPYATSHGWSVLRCCKDGNYSHRSMLGYTGRSAPDGPNYYHVQDGDVAALNLIDATDPNFIPAEAINFGLKFIKEQLESGKKILIHCNAGHSRGPTVCLMYLRTIGEFPSNFHQSESKFKTLYSKFDPQPGIEQFARANWRNLLYEGVTRDV